MRVLSVTVFVQCLFVTSSLWAHHTFRTVYDSSKPLDLKGVVTKIDWVNPHVHFWVDVRDDKTGRTVNWVFEMSAPNELEKRHAWTRESMSVGDEIVVTGSRARNGCTCGGVRFLTLVATGRKLGPIWG
jgi:hypothetical protein